MDSMTLLVEARVAGLDVRVEGDRLIVRGPKTAAPLAQQLLDRKPEVLELLSGEDYEVAWRVEFMRTQVRPTGPVPFLVARRTLSDTRGLCLSCDAPLPEGATVRCAPCVRAAERVLNELREDVRSSGAQ